MTFSILSVAVVAVSSFMLAKYTDVNVTRLLVRLGGYSSIYYDKFKKTVAQFRGGPVTRITRLEVDGKLVTDYSCISPNSVMAYESVKIYYTFNGKNYVRMYFNSAPIVFPSTTTPATSSSSKGFAKSCDDIILVSVYDSDGQTISITMKDVETIKQYSGPSGTFYSDLDQNYITSVKFYMLQDMGIHNSDCTIKLLYSNGDSIAI